MNSNQIWVLVWLCEGSRRLSSVKRDPATPRQNTFWFHRRQQDSVAAAKHRSSLIAAPFLLHQFPPDEDPTALRGPWCRAGTVVSYSLSECVSVPSESVNRAYCRATCDVVEENREHKPATTFTYGYPPHRDGSSFAHTYAVCAAVSYTTKDISMCMRKRAGFGVVSNPQLPQNKGYPVRQWEKAVTDCPGGTLPASLTCITFERGKGYVVATGLFVDPIEYDCQFSGRRISHNTIFGMNSCHWLPPMAATAHQEQAPSLSCVPQEHTGWLLERFQSATAYHVRSNYVVIVQHAPGKPTTLIIQLALLAENRRRLDLMTHKPSIESARGPQGDFCQERLSSDTGQPVLDQGNCPTGSISVNTGVQGEARRIWASEWGLKAGLQVVIGTRLGRVCWSTAEDLSTFKFLGKEHGTGLDGTDIVEIVQGRNLFWLRSEQGSFLRSVDNLQTYDALPIGGQIAFLTYHDGSLWAGLRGSGIFVSRDFGGSFTLAYSAPGFQPASFAADLDTGTYVIGGDNGKVLVTRDKFKTINSATLGRSRISTCAFLRGGLIVMPAAGASLYRSFNWGSTFPTSYTFRRPIKRVRTTYSGLVFVLLGNGEIYVSEDEGVGFTKLSPPIVSGVVEFGLLRNDTIVVAGNNKLAASDDYSRWRSYRPTLSVCNTNINSIAVVDGVIPSAIDDRNQAELPKTTAFLVQRKVPQFRPPHHLLTVDTPAKQGRTVRLSSRSTNYSINWHNGFRFDRSRLTQARIMISSDVTYLHTLHRYSDVVVLVSRLCCLPSLSLCDDSPSGKFCPASGATDLTSAVDCTAGSYCRFGAESVPPAQPSANCGDADDSCVPGRQCPSGHYCPQGSSAPTLCPSGTSGSPEGSAAASDCSQCPAGHYCGRDDAAAVPCDAGFLCSAGSSVERPTGVNAICPVTKYCPAGATTALPCGDGEFSDVECLECPASKYCDNGEIVGSCAAGYVCVLGVGPSDKPSGASGTTEATELGVQLGSSCPAGSYCPLGSVTPARCSPGETTPNDGATSSSACSGCTAGFYCPLSDTPTYRRGYKTQLLRPTYFNEIPPVSPLRKFSRPVTPFTDLLRFKPAARVHFGQGTYSDTEGAEVCQPCAAGYVCTGGATTPQPTSPTQGYVCPKGHYCPAGTTQPLPCPPGTINAEEGIGELPGCLKCTPGTFADKEAQTACSLCGGTSSSETGDTTCTCEGENRGFQKLDGTCLCKPFFEAYSLLRLSTSGESHALSADVDSSTDCQPVVQGNCKGDVHFGHPRFYGTGGSQTVRLQDGSCTDEAECTKKCGSRGGRLLAEVGNCECFDSSKRIPACDADCKKKLKSVHVRNNKLVFTSSSTSVQSSAGLEDINASGLLRGTIECDEDRQENGCPLAFHVVDETGIYGLFGPTTVVLTAISISFCVLDASWILHFLVSKEAASKSGFYCDYRPKDASSLVVHRKNYLGNTCRIGEKPYAVSS
ncbi:UNVERIFIED_CONTAM: hypothetical protein H355_005182 [Colinus virginianus]|nr:hypothetical protein H355_005182 [Colinus virginianus]